MSEATKLPDEVARRFELKVTQPKHWIPGLGRKVDLNTVSQDDAEHIARLHPSLLKKRDELKAPKAEPEPAKK